MSSKKSGSNLHVAFDAVSCDTSCEISSRRIRTRKALCHLKKLIILISPV